MEYGSAGVTIMKTTQYGSDDGGWVHLDGVVRKVPVYASADRGLMKAPEQESTKRVWIHYAPIVRKVREYGSPMEGGPAVACSVKTTEYGSDDGGRVRLGVVVRKAPEHESTELGWVYHAPFMRETTEYGSAMEDGSTVAQQCGKRQSTDLPWPVSCRNDSVRVRPGAVVRKTPEPESTDGGWAHRGLTVRGGGVQSIMIQQ
ncbi:hypothetical protein Y032_0035g2982 [Ancylostoma ceylanicum]|uniref:Uncharacterized protein n=1 Tax=Ancylostoma ceylanicum TaxID=53326 RepID=A0A016UMT7_9BILA|nr:hypothetical protein Y032_0035g2982 [Ancylostoma ceylanicum]